MSKARASGGFSPEMKVEGGATVTLHFSLALESGAIIDSNFAGKPAAFTVGDGNLPPGFEQVLLGLKAGDEIERTLAPGQAFGEINAANRRRFPLAGFRPLLQDELMPMETGSVVMFKDAAGFNLPGVITSIGEGEVEVDFNHPLAGREIVFRAAVVSIVASDAQILTLD